MCLQCGSSGIKQSSRLLSQLQLSKKHLSMRPSFDDRLHVVEDSNTDCSLHPPRLSKPQVLLRRSLQLPPRSDEHQWSVRHGSMLQPQQARRQSTPVLPHESKVLMDAEQPGQGINLQQDRIHGYQPFLAYATDCCSSSSSSSHGRATVEVLPTSNQSNQVHGGPFPSHMYKQSGTAHEPHDQHSQLAHLEMNWTAVHHKVANPLFNQPTRLGGGGGEGEFIGFSSPARSHRSSHDSRRSFLGFSNHAHKTPQEEPLQGENAAVYHEMELKPVIDPVTKL